MNWWRRNLRPPAAVIPPTAGAPPESAVPPPGPLPRHDTGPIAYQLRRYDCGCMFIYTGGGEIKHAFACATVDDLRQWDQELQT